MFYEHSITGKPIMRPLWAEFSDDENNFDEENQWLIGRGLLVRPVVEPDVKTVSIYLPGREQCWYEFDTNKVHVSPGAVYFCYFIKNKIIICFF